MRLLGTTLYLLLLHAVEAFVIGFRWGRLTVRRIHVSSKDATTQPYIIPGNPKIHHTTRRIKDPTMSIPVYEILGYKLLDRFDFPDHEFSLYFVGRASDRDSIVMPGTPVAHERLWHRQDNCIALMHMHGTNMKASSKSYVTNEANDGCIIGTESLGDLNTIAAPMEKFRNCFLYVSTEVSERSLSLSGVIDPDGYSVELIGPSLDDDDYQRSWIDLLCQRKNEDASLQFYQSMGLVLTDHGYDAAFSSRRKVDGATADADINDEVLYLNFDHDKHAKKFKRKFQYTPEKLGFGHVAFVVDDVLEACAALVKMGYRIGKHPDEELLKGLAIVYDPEGHSVGIIQRGRGIDCDVSFGETK